eukprot:COSAG06_NODE_7468_length_2493_cov_298.115706_5_plen_45_part_01
MLSTDKTEQKRRVCVLGSSFVQVGTIHVPRKLRDLTSNLPNPRCA